MNKKIINFSIVVCFIFSASAFVFAQAQPAKLIKRTTYKTDNFEFGAGGTVTIVGAPQGSIEVEGWQKNEIEISAEIEMQGESEADLELLSQINGFTVDDGFGHVRILSVGTHDKNYIKKIKKKVPKKLLAMPFKIDYKIKVPTYCDLEIDGGKGDLKLGNVDGVMRIKAIEGNAVLNLVGGAITATFGAGNVDVNIGSRSWRGRFADIQLASGTLNVQLPQNFNAEIDASVLRNGKIESSLTTLKPRNRTKFTDKQMSAKAGNGGAPLTFTVGDGTLKMSPAKL